MKVINIRTGYFKLIDTMMYSKEQVDKIIKFYHNTKWYKVELA